MPRKIKGDKVKTSCVLLFVSLCVVVVGLPAYANLVDDWLEYFFTEAIGMRKVDPDGGRRRRRGGGGGQGGGRALKGLDQIGKPALGILCSYLCVYMG